MQRFFELGMATVQKELRVFHRSCVSLRIDQLFYARALAAVNVVLQTGPRMIPRQIDLAAWNEKAALDHLRYAIGQLPGKVRPVVRRAVLLQAAGNKHLGIAVGQRQLYVGVGLVIAEQDVEAGLALLDEIVLKRQ